MEERRKYIRFKSPFPIRYTHKESSEEASGVIQDISYGGARIMLDSQLESPPSEPVSLFILFPEDTLRILGKIIWQKTYPSKKELGLSFINIPDGHKRIIYNRIFKHFGKEFTRRWWQPLFVLKQ